MKVFVENIPLYARDYEWIVATPVDGELWFWGAYTYKEKAIEVAKEHGGVVVENDER